MECKRTASRIATESLSYLSPGATSGRDIYAWTADHLCPPSEIYRMKAAVTLDLLSWPLPRHNVEVRFAGRAPKSSEQVFKSCDYRPKFGRLEVSPFVEVH